MTTKSHLRWGDYAVVAAATAVLLMLAAVTGRNRETTIVIPMGDGVCEFIAAHDGDTIRTSGHTGTVGACEKLPAGVCATVDAWRQMVPCDNNRTACGEDGTRVYSIDPCEAGDVPFAMWCAGLEEWRILHGLDQLGIPQHAVCRPKGTS